MNVTITLDGQQLETDSSKTIIQAARDNGIAIPNFCWHPALSIAGNCRICLVDSGMPKKTREGQIERDASGNAIIMYAPKLQIACQTTVADGMVVQSKSPKVINAREAVMEFLLINHPLDCPICDEAGECKLQEYAYKHSVGYSRFEFEKVRKPKRVDIGTNVMLDTERCIMCSRCVRFCDEIVKETSLTFSNRGDHVELTTFPGTSLDNDYSMNTIDLCPVGALTSKDFRFKARVWEMSSTDSVCVGCSRGCNTTIGVRNNEVLRLTPRFNDDVNNYWMCDNGRLNTFKSVNAETRIKAPMIRKEGKLVEVGWDEAFAKVASELRRFQKNEIAVLGSAFATNEDNFLLQKFAKQVLGTKNLDFFQHIKDGDEDELLIRADKTPNSFGTKEMGVGNGNAENILNGTIKVLYLLEDNIAENSDVANLLSKLDFLVVHSSNHNETTKLADVVFSASTYAEKNGTFTNFQGNVQRIRPAVATLEQDRALDGFAMSRLDKFGSQFDRWMKGEKRDARSSWKIISGVANAMNAKWKYNSAEDVFKEIANTVSSFQGMSYFKMRNKGMKLNSNSVVEKGV
ncbi:MAG: molybdopterin-dependent oxidoreductase [Ignavibacteriales bacterium]|nr:molybdopterin-dependent oxidoreductase [Ignavibacteriales bacterium]